MTQNGLTNLLKCQKIKPRKNKNGRNYLTERWFLLAFLILKVLIFLSDILVYWHHENLLTFLDQCSDVFGTRSIFWLFNYLEYFKNFLTFWHITLPRTVQLRTPDWWTNPDIRLGETRVIKIALSVLSTSKLDQIHDLKLN